MKDKVKKLVFCIFFPSLGVQKTLWLLQHCNNIFFKNVIRHRLARKFSVSIHRDAEIGKDLKLPHPYSVVIGMGSKIGDNCTLFQGVTLGMSNPERFEQVRSGRTQVSTEYPRLGNNVTVCAGSIIFGGVSIGDNVVIGANSVVNKSFPSDVTLVGSPARVVKSKSKVIR